MVNLIKCSICRQITSSYNFSNMYLIRAFNYLSADDKNNKVENAYCVNCRMVLKYNPKMLNEINYSDNLMKIITLIIHFFKLVFNYN